jgi:TolB-like protein/DNA-binding winged helix-turn-helix (wHTH) protein/Tfp pilus assembly protein PilF
LLLSRLCAIIFATSTPAPVGGRTAQSFHFGEFTLDQSRFRLQRGERILRLEKRPMELLFLLVEKRGELVSREEVAGRLWGTNVFVDVDHSINTAVGKVRRVLRDDPEKPRFIETVVGKGYRFAAPVTSNGIVGVRPSVEQAYPPVQGAATPIPSTDKRVVSPKIKLLLTALLALLVATAGWWLNRNRVHRSTARPGIQSLAVLPLKNLSGDPGQEYLADGMTEELIALLSNIHNLRVISRTSIMGFKDKQLSVPAIARALGGVDAVVEGSVTREGNRIRVQAQLIRADTDEHFWSETYDRDLQDVLALQSDVAQAIATRVEATVTGSEHQRLSAGRSISPAVYESYLKGRYVFLNKPSSRASIEESMGYFEEAIKKDPSFAPAYLGLAEDYGGLGTVFIGAAPPEEARRKAIAAVRKALQLDPNLVEAHVLLADMLQRQWHWAEAEGEYRRALELNPNDAEADDGLASWLLSQGRLEEALAWERRGRELDPLAVSGADIGWILFLARQYDEAIQEYRGDLAIRPDSANALWELGFALMFNHQSEQAIPCVEKSVSLSGRSPGGLAVLVSAYASAGRRGDALRLLAELKRRKQTGYVPPGAFVIAYLGLDDHDQTFAWLEQAYDEQSNILKFLKVHPIFDPLRNDPRFKDLVRRVGLG